MIEESQRKRGAREYFIKCEEAWNSDEIIIITRVIKIQNRKIIEYRKQMYYGEKTDKYRI